MSVVLNIANFPDQLRHLFLIWQQTLKCSDDTSAALNTCCVQSENVAETPHCRCSLQEQVCLLTPCSDWLLEEGLVPPLPFPLSSYSCFSLQPTHLSYCVMQCSCTFNCFYSCPLLCTGAAACRPNPQPAQPAMVCSHAQSAKPRLLQSDQIVKECDQTEKEWLIKKKREWSKWKVRAIAQWLNCERVWSNCKSVVEL
jgi:hypothetical protein